MAAAANLSWSHLLMNVSASLDAISERPSAEILNLRPSITTFDPLPGLSSALSGIELETTGSTLSLDTEGESVADWMSTLDIINGIGSLADEQKLHIEEQARHHQNILNELKRDLALIQERLLSEEMRTQEIQTRADIQLQRVQADADAQVQQIRAEAETRVNTIRAEADSLVETANKQMCVANLRASTAEQWLQRIDAATKALLLSGRMKADHRRA